VRGAFTFVVLGQSRPHTFSIGGKQRLMPLRQAQGNRKRKKAVVAVDKAAHLPQRPAHVILANTVAIQFSHEGQTTL
jgi:hypothetical protein